MAADNQPPQESRTELELLGSNLQKVQQRIFDQWHGEGLERKRLAHEQWLKEATDEINSVKDQLRDLDKGSAENKEAVASQKRKAEEISLALRDAYEKRQKLLCQKEQLSKEITAQMEANRTEQELLEAQQKATRSVLSELTKAEGFFQQRMGLRFKKLDSDNLQFVFTEVDSKDPERVFYFTIKVADKEYKVTDCCPQVAGIDDLLQQLNKSNNLMAFVVGIRQKFKLAC